MRKAKERYTVFIHLKESGFTVLASDKKQLDKRIEKKLKRIWENKLNIRVYRHEQ